MRQSGGVHLFVIETEDVAPIFLCLVHRQIRLLHQRLGVIPIVRIDTDADAGAGDDFGPAFERKWPRQRLEDAPGYRCGVLWALHRCQQQYELITPQTRERASPRFVRIAQHPVSFPHASRYAFGHALEQHIPGVVAQCVVDLLEAIQVHEERGTQRPRTPRTSKCLFEAISQQ